MNNETNRNMQLWAAVAVAAVGCALLVAGFCVEPPGQVHQSVLIGFGECLTFAGSLLGIAVIGNKLLILWKMQSD